MSPIPINLAVEDELSEVVLRRLLSEAGRGYAVGAAYGRNGFGYLRRTIGGWNQAAQGRPFIVLTDLDDADCPLSLINSWLPVPIHPNLLFRIAVREVESWLLSDTVNFARFLGCSVSRMPPDPDRLPDPKQTLIDLAKKSRSSAHRASLVPRAGSTAKQGPDYNACLSAFVRDGWSIEEAAKKSPSLGRTVRRLRDFTPAWPDAI